MKKGHAGNLRLVSGVLRDDEGRVFVPDSPLLRTDIVRLVHNAGPGGHRHSGETLVSLRAAFVWKGMGRTVDAVVGSCLDCLRNKVYTTTPPPAVARRVSSVPFGELHMDEASGLPPVHGFSAVWLVLDRLTGFLFAFPIRTSCEAKELARLLVERVFAIVGIPARLVSDADSRLTGHFFQLLHKELRIEGEVVSKGNHRANGLAERTVRSLKEYLRTLCNAHRDDWPELLPLFVATHNMTHQDRLVGATPQQ